jgi:hypothetical protein
MLWSTTLSQVVVAVDASAVCMDAMWRIGLVGVPLQQSKEGAKNWGRLKSRTDDVLSNMPFLASWNETIT